MGLHNATLSHVQRLEVPADYYPFYLIIPLILAGALIFLPRSSHGNEPPQLAEQFPYVSNTWQYVNNMTLFMDRAL